MGFQYPLGTGQRDSHNLQAHFTACVSINWAFPVQFTQNKLFMFIKIKKIEDPTEEDEIPKDSSQIKAVPVWPN
jgi:hypothetical protein